MFKKDQCELCGTCLTECQWMEVEQQQAIEWMKKMKEGEHTSVIDNCITCYSCNERCPNGARPFDLFASLQEKYLDPDKKPGIETMEEKFVFSGELRNIPKEDPIMTTCVFEKTDPHLIQGEIYDLPKISGKPFFCWVLFSHMRAQSVEEKHAQEFVDRLTSTGAKEIICFHDDCYAMLATLAPEYGINVPFRPIHLSEYLAGYLKKNKDRIRPLEMDIAYQRPCASKQTPEKEHFIDEVFQLAGVKRVERKYDRKNGLCCGGVKFMLDLGDPKSDQEINILDAKENGAQALVCLCPVCIHSLTGTANELELPIVFFSDIARMALGELSTP
jgi:Fe-S oxidoreductase